MKRLVPAVIALGVVTFAITTLLLVRGYRPAAAPPMAFGPTAALRYSELILDADLESDDQAGLFYSRPQMDRWSEEQVRRFWIPPEQIVLEILQRENDLIVEDILADIP